MNHKSEKRSDDAQRPSVAVCYARFRLRDKIAVQGNDERMSGQFIGIDSDGIVTYLTENGEYLTAWDCNVYSA